MCSSSWAAFPGHAFASDADSAFFGEFIVSYRF